MTKQKVCNILGIKYTDNQKKYDDVIYKIKSWYSTTILEKYFLGQNTLSEFYRTSFTKRIGEDYAARIFNFETRIKSDDEKVIEIIVGDSETQDGGIFGDNDFWTQTNAKIEQTYAFAGSFAETVQVVDGEIKIKYFTSENIIPISWNGKNITDFVIFYDFDDFGKKITAIERYTEIKTFNNIIKKTKKQYKKTNMFFESKAESNKAYVFDNVAYEIITDYKQAIIFSSSSVNNIIPDFPLSIPPTANATAEIKHSNMIFDQLAREINTADKMQFVDNRLFIEKQYEYTDSGEVTKKARETFSPSAHRIAQVIYTQENEISDADSEFYFKESVPELRATSLLELFDNSLKCVGRAVGLGDDFYTISNFVARTATEARASGNELSSTIGKERVFVDKFLREIVTSILGFLEQKTDMPIITQFDRGNGLFYDEQADLSLMLQEVVAGVRPKWQYLMKRDGISEKDARLLTSEATEESGIIFNDTI